MHSQTPRYALWSLVVGAVAALLVAGTASALPAQDEPKSEALKQLLKERLAIVTTIYEQRLTQHKQGVTGLDQVNEARAQLLRAKLDLAETKSERIAVHEEMVKLAEERLAAVESLSKSGVIPQFEVLSTKLQLLETRIGLERARTGT